MSLGILWKTSYRESPVVQLIQYHRQNKLVYFFRELLRVNIVNFYIKNIGDNVRCSVELRLT